MPRLVGVRLAGNNLAGDQVAEDSGDEWRTTSGRHAPLPVQPPPFSPQLGELTPYPSTTAAQAPSSFLQFVQASAFYLCRRLPPIASVQPHQQHLKPDSGVIPAEQQQGA
ncbi:hypothetical protein Droror1_Dr00000270 [Drosera rotundifolia]